MSSVPSALDAIAADLTEADRRERIEDSEHQVHECQSPVFLFVELDDDRVTLHADVPIEAPTVRGFVAVLVEGLKGATVSEVLALRGDLLQRLGLLEILGMQRLNGLNGVLHHVKSQVARAAATRPDDPTSLAPSAES
jgi:cysteine desulfuration protein SufE